MLLPQGRSRRRQAAAFRLASTSTAFAGSSASAQRQPDSIYEVGSITRTFTGLLLAQMVQQKQVQLDEFVRLLLPPGTVPAPAGSEITLLDLAAKRSGLPPMPDNISIANLEQSLRRLSLCRSDTHICANAAWETTHIEVSDFGSLGFGLLGVALANRTGTSSMQSC